MSKNTMPRGRVYRGPGWRRNRGTGERMNNDTHHALHDADRFRHSEDSVDDSSLNDMEVRDDNVDLNSENVFRSSGSDYEKPVGKEFPSESNKNSKPLNMVQNITSGEQMQKNLQFANMQNTVPSNIHSLNPFERIQFAMAEVQALEEQVNPLNLIMDYRTKIITETEQCNKNHGIKIGNLSQQVSKANGNGEIVLRKHLENMKLQNSSFHEFIHCTLGKLNDLCSFTGDTKIMTIYNKLEEILNATKSECKRFSKTLPAYALKNEIKSSLGKGQVTVISCDAVYYGNTLIPLLIEDMFSSGLIASCEVNEVLALSSSRSCASLANQDLGQLVDYSRGKGSDTGRRTKILYMTLQELFWESLKDPTFSRFSCIIINDLVYRDIEADILLASLRECLRERPDLKLIFLVSVEETALKFEKYFLGMVGSLIHTENLIFPVQVIWKEAACSADDDFVTEVSNMCVAIHVLNKVGNIVAFLPTDEDVQKAYELTQNKLLEYNFKDVVCVPISEKIQSEKALQFWEQRKENNRNIIFTHNGFEAMMFPDVHHVVDCGRNKEICYDHQKRLEIQKTSFISRSRAKVRKNVAGRSSSGVCYRLYSKENFVRNMAPNELPELLRRSPLNALAKIFQYAPKDALTTELIEPFSKKVKEEALKSLKSLDALKDGRLTNQGEDVIKLPFLPQYSKLIVLGARCNCPLEAIVIVSLFLVKGCVFIKKSGEEWKRNIDAAKLNFNQKDSDTLTFLNIYKQWAEARSKELWCEDNCVDFTFLESVHAKVNEVCEIVYKKLGKSDLYEFSNDFNWSYMQELIFACFRDNLCVYTGHFLSGYRSLTAGCIVFLHPSTSISRKENLPQFIVYDKFISKSRNFVTHITSVPAELVNEAVRLGHLEVSEQDLSGQQLVPCVIDHLGDMVIKHVLKPEKLRDLEEQIKDKAKSELIVIEPSVEKGSVTLYSLPGSTQKAEEVLREILEESKKNMRDERETRIIELHKGRTVVPVSISWCSGATISSVTVSDQQRIPSKPLSGLLDSISVSNCEESTTHSYIRLSWLRRACTGNGYARFDNPEDFSQARKLILMSSVQIRGQDVEAQVSKKNSNELLISGLHPETTDTDLKEGIQSSLDKSVAVSHVDVIRLDPFETSLDDVRKIERELMDQCLQFLQAPVVEVKAHKPKNEDIEMTAEIKISNDSNLSLQAKALNSRLRVRGACVKSRPAYYSELFCSAEVLAALKSRIEASLRKLVDKYRFTPENDGDDMFRVETDRTDHFTVKLKLSSHSVKIIADLRKMVQDLLEGDVISAKDIHNIHKLFCHGGHLWLENLKKLENVHIIDEYKSNSVRLYGSPEACRSAALQIEKFLNSAEKEAVKLIALDGGKNNRVLLKALIQTYGVEMKAFIKTSGLSSAELDLRKCQLTLHGSAESIKKAEDELEELADKFSSDCRPEIQSCEEICPVCLYPALTLSFRLQNCGHLYCDVCLKGLVASVVSPLLCCIENCRKEIILEDIRKILDYDKAKIDELVNKSLKDYIPQNPNFMYCPSPDCSMFVDKSKVRGAKWKCSLCHNDICLECNTAYHHGFTCDMYQGTQRDSNYSFKVWKESAKDCKMCPTCGTAIQKTAGCNHMTCFTCHGHFCWLCLKAFPTGNEVYNHLPYCPSNQGR